MEVNEKIIFEMNSGYNLNGFEQVILDNMSLKFTNLGNIYVSRVDSFEEPTYYLKYNYHKHKKKLYSELDKNNINVVSSNMPFEIYDLERGTCIELKLNLIIVLDMSEFMQIKRMTSDFIFAINSDEILFVFDDMNYYIGELSIYENNMVVETEGFRSKVDYEDVSKIDFADNIIECEGFFYLENIRDFSKKIDLIGKFDSKIKYLLGEKINIKGNTFDKLDYDSVAFSKLTANISNIKYKFNKVFVFLKDDEYRIYDKKSKQCIWSSNSKKLSKLILKDGNYLIYDGVNFLMLDFDEVMASNLGLELIPIINIDNLAFTSKLKPVFLESSADILNISSIAGFDLLKIDKNLISDMKIFKADEFTYLDYYLVELRYSNKKVNFYVKESYAKSILIDVFDNYYNTIVVDAPIWEVYENWIKSVVDMSIFNYFSQIYIEFSDLIDSNHRTMDENEKLTFINSIVKNIHTEIINTDKASIYLTEMLSSNELKYFKTLGIDFDNKYMTQLKKIFFELRKEINFDLRYILEIANSSRILVENKSLTEIRLKTYDDENAKYIDKEIDDIIKALRHFYYNMLPHYIGRLIVEVFDIYKDMYSMYELIEESVLREELENRLKTAFVYKQFTMENDGRFIRKNVIDDMYSLVKFSEMKLESEYYNSGGYRK